MKEKKESNFSRLMDYAENYRYFTYISLVLSAVSSALALLPFYYIRKHSVTRLFHFSINLRTALKFQTLPAEHLQYHTAQNLI